MLAEKLLSTATHPRTPDAEALSAARKLGNLLDRAGGVKNVFGPPAASSPRGAPLSFNQKRQLHEELQGKLDYANHRIEQLERELNKERVKVEEQNQRIDSLKAALSDKVAKGEMSFIDFANRARVILGVSGGWVVEFVKQTKIEERIITNARVAGLAPDALVQLLPTLKPVRAAEAHSKTLPFTTNEVAQIREWARSMDDAALAHKATNEFMRAITEGHIKRLRSNLKNTTGGYGKEYGGALPVFSASGARRGHLVWGNFPDLELHVAREFMKGAGAASLARYLSEKTGFDVSPNQVTQRVYNMAPPYKLIALPRTSGPLSWPEVWLIGHNRTRRAGLKGWLTPTLKILGLDPGEGDGAGRKGMIGKSLDHLDPKLVAAFRASFREGVTEREELHPTARPTRGVAALTRRERSILDAFSRGQPIRDIAREMKIGLRFVEDAIHSCKKKLDCTDSDELVDFGLNNGFGH